MAHSAGALEYTDCISAEGLGTPNECSGYDTELSNGKAPVLELWGIWSSLSLPLLSGPL